MLKTIDEIRRACIDIGSSLKKEPETEELRKRIAEIQIRADATPPTDQGSITDLAAQLDAFEIPETAKRYEYRKKG